MAFVKDLRERLVKKYSEQFVTNQEKSMSMYEELTNSFKNDDNLITEYPNDFGGAYVDGSGNLNICLCNVTQKTQSEYQDRFKDKVKITQVSYPLQFLLSLKEAVSSYKKANLESDLAKNILSIGLSKEKNKIIVGLQDDNENIISQFNRKIVSSEAIEFTKAEKLKKEVDVTAGFPLSTATAGYRASVEGLAGFVQTAHATTQGGTVSDSNGNSFAVTRVWQPSLVDAAWCEITEADYSPVNTIHGTNLSLSTTLREPLEGTIVSLQGKYNSGDGIVIDESRDATGEEGDPLTDLIVADTSSTDGDSGGIVYQNDGINYNCGIHLGSLSDGSAISKSSNINSLLGVSPY